MPDRFEQKREELIKSGMGYDEAQVAKIPKDERVKKTEKAGK